MATFELGNERAAQAGRSGTVQGAAAPLQGKKPTKEECIVALKVYDQCRQQDCLTPNVLGPARAAETICIDGRTIKEGDVIKPPHKAVSVSIERLRLAKVIISDKECNPFKQGFWDIDIKYVFKYRLVFRDIRGSEILTVRATNIFNKRVMLFGSIGTDIVLATDLFNSDSETVDAEPFVLVEGKAVALAASLKFRNCCDCDCGRDFDEFDSENIGDFENGPDEVLVTIGLFAIIKLFRIVNLLVDSGGFCVPCECEDISPLNPCDFFDNLDFPMDVFSPPQKEEFFAGVSSFDTKRLENE